MIAYTITAPLVDGLTYINTNGYSFTGKPYNGAEYIEEAHQTANGFHDGQVNLNYNLEITFLQNSDNSFGSQIRNNANNVTQPNGDFNNANVNLGSVTTESESEISEDDWTTFTTVYAIGGNNYESGNINAYLSKAPKDVAGKDIEGADGPSYSMSFSDVHGSTSGSSTQNRYFNTIALQTTTKTTVTNYGKITTITQEKLAKVGTTITQSVGTSVVTLPTTTNAKSWTENTTTYTEATEDATVVTTSRGIDSYWKKTAHTVYILGKGETTAFLKSDVAINATNGGPTDTKACDTYSGPTTFTITRAAGTTSQKPAVADTATDIGFEAGEGSQTTVTNRWIVAANSEGVRYYPGYSHHLPLSSANITIQTGVSESSATQAGNKQGEGQWGANAKTTTRSAWSQTSVTYNLAGVSYTESIPINTIISFELPYAFFGTQIQQESLGDFKDETQEYSEEGNFSLMYVNEGKFMDGGGADAFYGLAYAWGTLGGTTAEPYQSISVDGIVSSESVTWPFVSISAGVATPKPFVTVSQKPETSATSSTAATKTEATTRRIWGEEFAKTTSSQNSSTGTSGSTITPIQAGGGALTSFQLGGARGFPVNQLAGGWIPAPAMFVIGGIAQTNDSTAIIPPGEYANSTITEPKSFSGSSIANTYFEPKAAVTYLCYPS